MKLLAALLVISGSVGAAGALWGVSQAARPRDLLLAILAPIAILAALAGGILFFVPRLFG